MSAEVTIYALRDSDLNVRYVGKSVDLKGRIYTHKRERPWFFDYIVLEETDEGTWEERERFWIKFFRGLGSSLENITDGGDGSSACLPETRRKIARTLTGVKHTAERIEKMAAALRGKTHSDETKEKIRGKLKAYVKTEEHRQNLSNSLKGKSTLSTPEAKENHRRALTGRTLSEEHIESIRQGMIRRYKDPEERRKTSEATKAALCK